MPLVLTPQAQKQLEGLPKTDARRLLTRLEAIAAAPAERHAGVIALTGEAGAIRVRQGDWRAICSFEYDDLVVRKIAHRREAYR
ncbi:MAG TPA: type II toxin-antitoxin system RelE/ParE family toxin [Acetobacteraceae bacterium]